MAEEFETAAFDLLASPDQLLEEALASGQVPFTGRQIVTFKETLSVSDMASEMKSFGPSAVSSDFASNAPAREQLGDASSLVFEELNMAILVSSAEAGISASQSSDTVEDSAYPYMIEPETFVFALDTEVQDSASATWGLKATDVISSNYSGSGVKVAVLDTGMDLGHPDFAGRSITSSSFVPRQSVQDGHGHGTHCIGTACGPKVPKGVPRYGIAHNSSIFAGKVLSNSGSGSTGGVLAGMNWAIANRCEVISMSLGGSGGPFNYYNQAMQRALQAGSLIIAASGNDSNRPHRISPTGSPANSRGAVAVAALDNRLKVASFSNGGKIEIAAPGVNVFSSLPRPRMYASWSGTSMATPHVAGIAALLAESDPNLRGVRLARKLMQTAKRLPFSASDVGSGLVKSP